MTIVSQFFRSSFRSSYSRIDDLPAILGVSLEQLDNNSIDFQKFIIWSLKKKLIKERRLGIQKRWGYDINRHMLLVQAYRYEKAFLDTIKRNKK